jgi:hypothetical protein
MKRLHREGGFSGPPTAGAGAEAVGERAPNRLLKRLPAAAAAGGRRRGRKKAMRRLQREGRGGGRACSGTKAAGVGGPSWWIRRYAARDGTTTCGGWTRDAHRQAPDKPASRSHT